MCIYLLHYVRVCVRCFDRCVGVVVCCGFVSSSHMEDDARYVTYSFTNGSENERKQKENDKK